MFKMDKEQIIEQIIPGAVVGGTVIAFGIGLIGIALGTVLEIHNAKLEQKGRRKLITAVRKSAGQDRIWDTNEKRQFLDKYGLSREIIGEGQDIYFRTYPYHADVVAGYNLENNGGFLTGSKAKSGTIIGRINYSDLDRREHLEDYYKEKEKKGRKFFF
jgi:hypothetical protein